MAKRGQPLLKIATPKSQARRLNPQAASLLSSSSTSESEDEEEEEMLCMNIGERQDDRRT